jgi:hypothetical protein
MEDDEPLTENLQCHLHKGPFFESIMHLLLLFDNVASHLTCRANAFKPA